MKNKEVVLVSTLLPQVHVGRLLRVVHSFVVCSAESRSIRVEVEGTFNFGTWYILHFVDYIHTFMYRYIVHVKLHVYCSTGTPRYILN